MSGSGDERLDTNVGWAAFTSQGKILAVSEGPPNEPEPATIGTLDPSTLKPEGSTIRFEKAKTAYWPTLLSSDGRTVLMANENKPDGLVIDLVDGTTTPYSTEVPAVGAAELSPDGGRLVVFGLDRQWGVIDVDSLSEEHVRWLVPQQPYKGVPPWEVFWSADGTQLFTTANGSVELWDAETLTHLGSMSAGAKDNIATVMPLPDGHSVMMAHPQGDVLTWDLRPEHLLDVACSLAGRNLTETEWKDYVGDRPHRETCTTASHES